MTCSGSLKNFIFLLINFNFCRYFLVKLTVQEPIELTDDLFIKYLIVFKKWLSVEEVMDDKENIRNAFITQVKPKKTLWYEKQFFHWLKII